MPKRSVLYTKELLQELVKESKTVSDVVRKLGLRADGNRHAFISKRIREFGIDTSHFLQRKDFASLRVKTGKIAPQELLVLQNPEDRDIPGYRIRPALIEIGRPYVCSGCGIGPEWNGKELTLQVDHIDGRGWDNRPENLRFLCPNCHTQTDTFCSKNRADQKVHKVPNTCLDCGVRISEDAKRCQTCQNRTPRICPRKVERPLAEELKNLFSTMSMVSIGKKYGVSDNAVRKWFRSYDLEIPKRGEVA